MSQTTPPTITPSPPAPDRADRATFSSRATAWADWVKNHAVAEIAAVATNVYDNAVDAYNSAVAAVAAVVLSQKWAAFLGAEVEAGQGYSAKEHAVGTTVPTGSAKDWATAVGLVDGVNYSAKKHATDAAASASAAATSAASALTAPGTSATSTTSLTIGTGTQNLTIQTGKAFSVGQNVVIANTPSPYKRMAGVITAHDSGTGALTVSVDQANDTGTFSAWTVSLGTMPSAGVSLPPFIALSLI